MDTFGDLMELKIMGTRAEIGDVIHHLSPNSPKFFSGIKCLGWYKINLGMVL